MTSLFFYFIIIIVFFLFLYFIDVKNGTRSSFIARILLSETLLFSVQFVAALIYEQLFKGAVILFFSQDYCAPLWLTIVAAVILVALLCFFVFIILVFLLLCAMPLPKITYSAKIAPVMSVIASSLLFFYSFDVASLIFTVLLMLILTPLVFADHDYEVKHEEAKALPETYEMSRDELKQIYLQKQNDLKALDESYKRNPFVRINRGLH